MTFNLISVAVLLFAAFVIVFESIRSISKGIKKALITLVSVFIATFTSIVITLLISDGVFYGILEPVFESLEKNSSLESIYEKFPHLNEVIFSYADAIVSPILFLLIFVILRVILAIVFAIVFKVKQNKHGNIAYEKEDAPSYKKKPQLISALIGALSGFLVVVICFAPIVGSLKVVSVAGHKINETSSAFNFKIKDDAINMFDVFANDFSLNLLYYSGGGLVYNAVSVSKLNDNHFELESEIVGTFDGIDLLLHVGEVMSNIAQATDEQKDSLKTVGEKIDSAETMKRLAADIFPGIAKKWLKDEPYIKLEKPKVGRASSIFFDKMLYVCKSSTPDTIAADISTIINVFLISDEHNILTCEDYKTLLETANQTGAFKDIKAELEKNPRMKGVSLEIDNMSVRAVASAISGFSPEDYEIITQNITNTLNEALELDPEERIAYITNYAEFYINEYDIDLGPEITTELAEKLSDELLDTNEPITVDEVKEFWDEYTLTKDETLHLDSEDKDKIDHIIENEGEEILENIQGIMTDPVEN